MQRLYVGRCWSCGISTTFNDRRYRDYLDFKNHGNRINPLNHGSDIRCFENARRFLIIFAIMDKLNRLPIFCMKTLILNIEDNMYPEIVKYLRQFPNTIEIIGDEEKPKEEEVKFDPFEVAMRTQTADSNLSIEALKEEVFKIYKPDMK